MNEANSVELLEAITTDEAKGFEVLSVAAHLYSRFGVRFMQRDSGAVFCKFTIRQSKDDAGGREVSVYVLPPKGEHKYTRFMVFAAKKVGDPAMKFSGLTTQQVFDLLRELQNPTSYLLRLVVVDDDKNELDKAS